MPADTERCAFRGGWAGIIGKHMAGDKSGAVVGDQTSPPAPPGGGLQPQSPFPHLTPKHSHKHSPAMGPHGLQVPAPAGGVGAQRLGVTVLLRASSALLQRQEKPKIL